MDNYETVTVERFGSIAVVTLNRPNKRNAMNPQMHLDMTDALDAIRYDNDIKVLVLTGAGSAFSAGMDLREHFREYKDDPAAFERISRLGAEWRTRTLKHFPKVTIAMVNGHCIGGAFSIVEACDLSITANEAGFCLSEINFHMFPGGPVSKSLANLLRPRDALFYGLTGRTFDGMEAARIGLVNYSVAGSELRTHVMSLASEIAEKDAAALRATKEAYRFSLEMSWDAAMDYARTKVDQVTLQQQWLWKEEGIDEFLQKKDKPGPGSAQK